jgi:hypothetical protein
MRHQQAKAEEAGQAQAAQQAAAEQAAAQQAPPGAPAAAAPGDVLDQLTQLGALRDQGVLTEAEFEAQKARILAQ